MASAYKLDRSGSNRFNIDLTPQILRTCKAVHREATSVLYSENVFRFLFRLNSREISYPGRDTLDTACEDFYQIPAGRLDDEIYGVLRYSEFAAFLLQIGRHYTAYLKKLRFDGDAAWNLSDAQNADWAIQAVTQLSKYHIPGLRQFKICRDDRFRRDFGTVRGWDGFENSLFTPAYDILEEGGKKSGHNNGVDINDPGIYAPRPPLAIHRKQEEAILKAVTHMVQEITWLKQLSFAGSHQQSPSYQKMEELQALVEARR